MEIQASYVLQFFAIWCTSQKSFHFSLCETASVLICRNTWCFTWNIWESLLRLFPFLNADKHSPLQVRGALSGGWADASVSGSWKLHWYKQVPTHYLLLCAIEAGDLLDSSQADIRNPLRYLLITECCFAAYQEWLAPLLIQASPNQLLIASNNWSRRLAWFG